MRPIRLVLLAATAALGALSLHACNKADAKPGAVVPPPSASSAAAPVALTTAAASALDSLSDSVLIERADKGRLMGQESSAIWVVMISDFQCPYCKTWHDASMAKVKAEYVNTGRVRMAYMNLPLAQHPHARAEAEGALCAGVQGKFWPFSEALFEQQTTIAKLPTIQPTLEAIARKLALDMPSFTACQRRDAIKALVESDVQQATKAGVSSTPSFLVGDFLVQGALELPDFRRAIDTALVMAKNAKRTR